MKPKKSANPQPVLRLVPNQPSSEVVDSLLYLLQEATAGRLIGLAYVGIFPKRHWLGEAAGEARRNPLFALGAIKMLETNLVDQINGRGE